MEDSLQQWLTWLENYRDKKTKFDKQQVYQVAEKLQLTKFAATVITVAGTNGKGSCVSSLERLLNSHGFKVASYTSPHIFSFNERIKVNLIPVPSSTICYALEEIKQTQDQLNAKLSYFEFATLAALYIFSQINLDYIVLEVGLGGRLDATNIVANDISILTSVGMDHCEILGDTLQAIASEKLGILKENTILVSTSRVETAFIRDWAKKLNCQLLQLGENFKINKSISSWDIHAELYNQQNIPLPKVLIDNFAAAIIALAALGVELKQDIVAKVAAELTVPGRYNKYQLGKHELIIDGAHNPPAFQLLVDNLKQESAMPTIIIAGFAADKDVAAIIKLFDVKFSNWLCCEVPGAKNFSLAEQEYLVRATGIGKCEICRDLQQALITAMIIAEDYERCGQSCRIVVCGSLYLVGPAIEFYKLRQREYINGRYELA